MYIVLHILIWSSLKYQVLYTYYEFKLYVLHVYDLCINTPVSVPQYTSNPQTHILYTTPYKLNRSALNRSILGGFLTIPNR